MSIELATPTADELPDVVAELSTWMLPGLPVQYHPGDLGWHARDGVAAVLEQLRTWRRDGELVALSVVDDEVARFALSPGVAEDAAVADAIAGDLGRDGSIFPGEKAVVEVRFGDALRSRLVADGWVADEPWTPLVRELSHPVEDCGLRIETTTADTAAVRVAVQRAAFPKSTFTVAKWQEMAQGAAYAQARCLVAFDDDDNPVAAATVWSAGTGRAGLIEPLGADAAFRGRGHGRAIVVACAAALRQLGAATATVCTTSANERAVAAYVSGGMTVLHPVSDFRRP